MTDKTDDGAAEPDPAAPAAVTDKPSVRKAHGLSVQYCDDETCTCSTIHVVLHDEHGAPFARGDMSPEQAMNVAKDLVEAVERQAEREAAQRAVRKH